MNDLVQKAAVAPGQERAIQTGEKEQEQVRRAEQHQGGGQALQDDQAHLARAAVAGHVLRTAQVQGQGIGQVAETAHHKGLVQAQALLFQADYACPGDSLRAPGRLLKRWIGYHPDATASRISPLRMLST